jgi:hypothetical protein
MLKILYAANNSIGAKIRLIRFLEAIRNKKYNLKIAAYIKSSPAVPIDWTLDALLDIVDQNKFSFDNDAVRIYYDQIKYFNPDLIISDCEIYTSYIANLLNIKLWIVSPLLLNKVLPFHIKHNVGIRKYYYYIIKSNTKVDNYNKFIIEHSDRNFVYSHFCDLNLFNLPENFKWVRPYYLIGKKSKIAEHEAVGISLNSNYNIINLLKNYKDSILFTSNVLEKFENIQNKNIFEYEEYSCNIKNAKYIFNEGYSSFMADAFYNNKFCFVLPDFYDPECIIYAQCSEYFGLSNTIFSSTNYENLDIMDLNHNSYNSSVNFLHEEIEKL